jgi:hypothetical protein
MRLLFIGSLPDHIPGTNQQILPEHHPLLEAASELGFAAALRGHTILVGSESPRTIDFYVMQGVLKACSEKPDQEFFVEIHRPEGTAAPYQSVPENLTISRIGYQQDSKPEFQWMVTHVLALDACDVCIVIGGGSSTRVIGYIAAERQKALLTVASFGGSAKLLWEKLKFVYKNHFGSSPAGDWLISEWSNRHANEIIGLAETFGRQKIQALPHTYFISYSWNDTAIADHVEVMLQRYDRIVLRDEKSIGAGQMLSEAVTTMINESDTFLAIYSKNFQESSWCPNELEYAKNRSLEHHKPERIILLTVDSTAPPLRFTDALRTSGANRPERELSIRKLLESEKS